MFRFLKNLLGDNERESSNISNEERVANILQNEGTVTSETDFAGFMAGVVEQLLQVEDWEGCYDPQHPLRVPDDRILSDEEIKLMRKGKLKHSLSRFEYYIWEACSFITKRSGIQSKEEIMPFVARVVEILKDRFHVEKRPADTRRKYTVKDSKSQPDDVLDGFEIQPRDITVAGTTFALTGASAKMSRQGFKDMIAANGGIYHERVTFGTKYLIVCEKTSNGYKYGSFGTKLRDAANKGCVLLAECDFLRACAGCS